MKKIYSGHIIFGDGFEWKALEPVFPDMFEMFLRETHQLQDKPEEREILLEINMMDIKNNRKPVGYIKEDKMKLYFPLVPEKSMVIHRDLMLSEEVIHITEILSEFLAEKGIEHTVEWDNLKILKFKKKK